MTILSSIFLAIVQAVMLFTTIKIVSEIKYNKKDYITIAGTIILSTVLYFHFGGKTIFLLMLTSVILLFIKKNIWGLVSVLVSFLIMYMANFISIWLATILFSSIKVPYIFDTIYILIFAFSTITIAYITKFFLHYFSNSDLSLNKIYLITVAILLFIALIIIYSYLPNKFMSFADTKGLILIYGVIIITIAVLVITISFSIVRQIQYKRNMQEIDNYYKYTLQIEKINNEMRKFRHDYVNILSTMSDFIREDDMKGLRTYFNEEILPMQDSMQMNAIKINGIENLKVREIKGLLTTKILQAQEKGIAINIEVPDEIDHINMRKIDLSRIIGIILDNAIEASEKIEEEPLIRLAFIKNEATSVTLIVMNKCEPDMPRLHTLFQQNFSTKGKNRGLGLSTLKEITDETPNVLLDTTIDANYFIQKVEILNS